MRLRYRSPFLEWSPRPCFFRKTQKALFLSTTLPPRLVSSQGGDFWHVLIFNFTPSWVRPFTCNSSVFSSVDHLTQSVVISSSSYFSCWLAAAGWAFSTLMMMIPTKRLFIYLFYELAPININKDFVCGRHPRRGLLKYAESSNWIRRGSFCWINIPQEAGLRIRSTKKFNSFLTHSNRGAQVLLTLLPVFIASSSSFAVLKRFHCCCCLMTTNPCNRQPGDERVSFLHSLFVRRIRRVLCTTLNRCSSSSPVDLETFRIHTCRYPYVVHSQPTFKLFGVCAAV